MAEQNRAGMGEQFWVVPTQENLKERHIGFSLDRDAPYNREVETPEMGKVIELEQVGGLHHRYTRKAA